MEFSEVVRRRRMVRRFDPDRPVEREAVLRALRTAVRAPSAGFCQGWDFVVLDTRRGPAPVLGGHRQTGSRTTGCAASAPHRF